MAIVNRDNDPSQQLEQLQFSVSAPTTTGGTYILGNLPFPCEVRKVAVTAAGLSGTPSIEVESYRLTSGGITINSSIMAALLVPAFGTSGVFVSASLGVAGSTQVAVAASDQLVATISGANSAVVGLLNVTVVVKKLQDIVSFYGSQS